MTQSRANEKIDFRWGNVEDSSREGGTTIPGYVLRNYHQLGVTPAQMMLIVHLSAFHYNSAHGCARPSLKTIAALMGYKKDDSVRRLVKELENMGLVRVKRVKGINSTYDFGPLAQQCLELDLESKKETKAAATKYPTDRVPHADGVPHSSGTGVPHADGDEDKEGKKKNTKLSDTPAAVGAEPAPKPKRTVTPSPAVQVIAFHCFGITEPENISKQLATRITKTIFSELNTRFAGKPRVTPEELAAAARAWKNENPTLHMPQDGIRVANAFAPLIERARVQAALATGARTSETPAPAERPAITANADGSPVLEGVANVH